MFSCFILGQICFDCFSVSHISIGKDKGSGMVSFSAMINKLV